MFFCHKKITIEDGVEFGPNVLIYDHDHNFRCEGGLKVRKFKESPVHIGKDCWVGANCIILKGTEIGDNTVIGAGCIVKGKIAPNTVLTYKRENRFSLIQPDGDQDGKES